MEIIEKIKKTSEYLNYIEEHILNVQKAWKELQEKCKDMEFVSNPIKYNILSNEVCEHDLSKLSEEEFVQYRKSFYPTEQEKYSGKYDFTNAWQHHIKENPHHWENWTKNIDSDWNIHCVHMVIDWMAMGYNFGDTAQEYYEKNKDNINLPDFAVEFIYEIFNKILKEINNGNC